jgi:eukaryotic-like serine/threonine-protein kinase
MKKHTLLLASLLSVILVLSYCVYAASSATVAGSNDCDWAMFRHDLGHSADASDTAASSDSAKLLWTYNTYLSVSSSPAVVGGCVYVGSWDWFVYCLNASSGKQIWNATTCGEVRSSPTVQNGRLYVGSDDGWVWCFNASDGGLLWYTEIGAPVRSSPAVADGCVYVGSGIQGFYCLNATDGSVIWFHSTPHAVNSSPAVSGGIIYFASDDYFIHALNASTGNEIWHHHTGCTISSPSVWNGCVFDGSFDGCLYCLNASTGSHVWTTQTEDSIYSSPAFALGCVYVGCDDGYLYCLNDSTGQQLWRSATGYWIWSSPAVADGNVYVGSEDNSIYCFNASTGAEQWSYATGDYVDSSPAVADGVLYVGSLDCNIYALTLCSKTVDPQPSADANSLTVGTVAFDAVVFVVAAAVVSIIVFFVRSNKPAKPTVSSENKIPWFSRHIDVLCIVGIVAFSTVFFINLGRGVLWVSDEQIYSQWAYHMFRSGDYQTPWGHGVVAFWVGKPQLLMWLMSLSYQFLGFSDFSSRFVSACFGVLSLIAVYFLGKKLYNRYVGFTSAVVLGTFTTFYLFARHAMTDVPLIFFMLCSIYFTVLSDRKAYSVKYAAISGLFFGLAFLTKQMVALIIPLILLLYFAATKRSLRFFFKRNIAAFAGAGLVLLVPWLIWMNASFGADFWKWYFMYNDVSRMISSVEGHLGSFLYYFNGLASRENLIWVTLLPFAVALCAFNATVKRSKADTLVLSWIAVVLLVFTLAQTKMFYYILPVFPAFALAISSFLYQTSKKILRKPAELAKQEDGGPAGI